MQNYPLLNDGKQYEAMMARFNLSHDDMKLAIDTWRKQFGNNPVPAKDWPSIGLECHCRQMWLFWHFYLPDAIKTKGYQAFRDAWVARGLAINPPDTNAMRYFQNFLMGQYSQDTMSRGG